MKNISIINAPDSVNFEADAGTFPPLGSLRVALSAQESGASVNFIDGQHYTSLGNVLERVDENTDIAGITFNRVTLPTVRPLISGLLDKGVKQIVAGGQAVIPIGEMFVSDFKDSRIMVCSGDGEPTIRGLVNGVLLSDIPNLVYFENGEVKKTHGELIDYEKLGVLDYSKISGFDWKDYFEVGHKVFENTENVASAYFADGCPNRISRGCSFCARRKTGVVRIMNPENAYEQLIHLQESGAGSVNIESDTFFSDSNFLKELVGIKESRGNLKLGLNVYGGVSELTENNLDLVQRLGVKSILVGVESGNDNIRRMNGKYFSDEQIFETARACNDREMRYNPAFVLGMIGETDETADETVEVAKELLSKGYSDNVYASLFMPFPGSPAYDLIKERLGSDPALSEKFEEGFSKWDYDWSQLIDGQVEVLTHTSRGYLCKCLEQISSVDDKAKSVIGDYSGKNE